jgi:hypothetical protein
MMIIIIIIIIIIRVRPTSVCLRSAAFPVGRETRGLLRVVLRLWRGAPSRRGDSLRITAGLAHSQRGGSIAAARTHTLSFPLLGRGRGIHAAAAALLASWASPARPR